MTNNPDPATTEREAIVTWLENIILRDPVYANGLGQEVIAILYNGTPQDLITAIRNGAHHRTTP